MAVDERVRADGLHAVGQGDRGEPRIAERLCAHARDGGVIEVDLSHVCAVAERVGGDRFGILVDGHGAVRARVHGRAEEEFGVVLRVQHAFVCGVNGVVLRNADGGELRAVRACIEDGGRELGQLFGQRDGGDRRGGERLFADRERAVAVAEGNACKRDAAECAFPDRGDACGDFDRGERCARECGRADGDRAAEVHRCQSRYRFTGYQIESADFCKGIVADGHGAVRKRELRDRDPVEGVFADRERRIAVFKGDRSKGTCRVVTRKAEGGCPDRGNGRRDVDGSEPSIGKSAFADRHGALGQYYGGKFRHIGKSAFADRQRRIVFSGKRHACKVVILKGIYADQGNGRGDLDLLDYRVRECGCADGDRAAEVYRCKAGLVHVMDRIVCFDIRKGIVANGHGAVGEGERRDRNTLEGAFADREGRRSAVFERDRRKRAGIAEGAFADRCDGRGDRDRCQLAVQERVRGDRRHRFGDHEGVRVAVGLIAQQRGLHIVFQNIQGVFVCLEGGVAVGGNDALNRHPVPEVRRNVHAKRDVEVFDRATRKYVAAKRDRFTFGDRHGERHIVVICKVITAVCERFVAHARHARGDLDFAQIRAALEGASAQRRHLAVLFVADRPDARLAEGVVADGHAADVVCLTLERERLKFAACKGEVADRLHGGGNFEGLFFAERDDPEECAFRDRRGRCGDRIAAGGFFSGEVHERVAAEEHAVLRTVGGRGALRDLDVSERGARECVGRGFGQIAQLVELRDRGVVSGKGDVCKPCGQGDRGERAVREGTVADRECGRACAGFFEYDRNKVFAACERLRPDLRHACGDDDAVDLASCKRVRGDRRHAVGDAVAPRLARGHVCGLGCMRLVLCAAVVQHAVLRGIPRIVGARVVNVHRRQRRAALERAHGDIRDGIGDVDLFEGGGEARKRVPSDLRDLSAVILCGDGDGGDEPEPRARADGVSVAHPGVCEHVVYPEGVQRNVFGERPGRQ